MYVPSGIFFVLFPCRACVHELSKPRHGCTRKQQLSRKSGVRFCRREIKAKTARGVAHTLPVHVCIMPPRNIPLIVQTTQVHKDTPHLPRKCMHTCSLVRIQDPLACVHGGYFEAPKARACSQNSGDALAAKRFKKLCGRGREYACAPQAENWQIFLILASRTDKSGLDIEGENSPSYIKHANPLMQGFHVTTQHKLLADWGMR
jgi:hypothetical protein